MRLSPHRNFTRIPCISSHRNVRYLQLWQLYQGLYWRLGCWSIQELLAMLEYMYSLWQQPCVRTVAMSSSNPCNYYNLLCTLVNCHPSPCTMYVHYCCTQPTSSKWFPILQNWMLPFSRRGLGVRLNVNMHMHLCLMPYWLMCACYWYHRPCMTLVWYFMCRSH